MVISDTVAKRIWLQSSCGALVLAQFQGGDKQKELQHCCCEGGIYICLVFETFAILQVDLTECSRLRATVTTDEYRGSCDQRLFISFALLEL